MPTVETTHDLCPVLVAVNNYAARLGAATAKLVPTTTSMKCLSRRSDCLRERSNPMLPKAQESDHEKGLSDRRLAKVTQNGA